MRYQLGVVVPCCCAWSLGALSYCSDRINLYMDKSFLAVSQRFYDGDYRLSPNSKIFQRLCYLEPPEKGALTSNTRSQVEPGNENTEALPPVGNGGRFEFRNSL